MKFKTLRFIVLPTIWISFAAYGDTLFVGNWGNNNVIAFDSSGTPVIFASQGINGPGGMAFGNNGNLFVANYNDNTIYEYDSYGNATLFANSGLSNPQGIAFDAAGNLFVANHGDGTIEKFNPNGVASVFASGMSTLGGLAIDGNGNVFATSTATEEIYKIDPQGHVSVFATFGMATLVGLAFDMSGNLYVSDVGSGIYRLDAQGRSTLFGNISGAVGIAFDGVGNLYAADAFSSAVMEFDPNGNGRVFASTGLNVPQFLAIQNVPEPSSMGLSVVSVAALICVFSNRIGFDRKLVLKLWRTESDRTIRGR